MLTTTPTDCPCGNPAHWGSDNPFGWRIVERLAAQQLREDQDALGAISSAVAEARANPLPKQGGDRRSEDANQACNTSLKPKHGTSEYTLRRLARDGRDDLLDRIEEGEISVNKAAMLKPHCEVRAKERQKQSKGRGQKGQDTCPDLNSQSRDEAGDAFDVSGRTVSRGTHGSHRRPTHTREETRHHLKRSSNR